MDQFHNYKEQTMPFINAYDIISFRIAFLKKSGKLNLSVPDPGGSTKKKNKGIMNPKSVWWFPL